MDIFNGEVRIMEDLKKIRTMVHLAIYDKHYGQKDRRIVSHYRHGYVFKKNMGMRAGVIIGFLVLEVISLTYYMMFDDATFLAMLTKEYAMKEAFKLIALLIIYSVFCTAKYKRQYDKAQKRTDEYERRFEKFCRMEEMSERTQL